MCVTEITPDEGLVEDQVGEGAPRPAAIEAGAPGLRAAALGACSAVHGAPPVHDHVHFAVPPLVDAALQATPPIGEQPPLDDVAGLRVTGVHLPNLRTGRPQRQRNSRNATAKLTPPQQATTAREPPSAASEVPSIITARSASFSAVSGSARTNGCIASGKRA